MVHAGCVFVVNIHPSRTWISGCFESVRWNACMHRLDLGLYTNPKEFWGNGVRTHVNFNGKIPSTRGSEEGRSRNAASHRTESPTHYWLGYAGPISTPLFIENSSVPGIFPVAWLQMFCKMFTHVSFMLVFFQGFKDGKVFYCVKGFLVINEADA